MHPGPEPQWSADGQWWWDGRAWTQMWHAPRGLAWSGDSWVRAAQDAPAPAAPSVQLHAVPAPRPPAPAAAPRPAPAPGPAPVPRPAAVPPPAVASRPPREPAPRQVLAVSTPAPPARQSGPGNRTIWLVAAAMVLVLVGTSSVIVATILSRPGGPASSQSQLGTGLQNSGQIAATLAGRKFTRDVVPLELADAAPLRDVFVPGSVPGLIGQASTTTSDLGGTVTFYVFADAVWAEAFFETPPTAYGCGVCTSMDSPTEVKGVGDKATSYVLYRKTLSGKSWIATTTYVLRGSIVINGLYFPVNVSGPSPSPTDLAVPSAYAKAGIQLLSRT